MRIVRRYLFRTILAMTGLVLAVLLSLGAFIEFVGQLDDVGTGDYGMPQALLFALLQLPTYAFIMLPMAALLGSLLGLGGLAAHSEIIVLRAVGVSTVRLAVALTSTGIVLGLITLMLGAYVTPPLDQYGRQFRAVAKHGQGSLATGTSAWIRDGDTILNVSRLGDSIRFGGVFLFSMDPDGQLRGIGRADSAGIDDANRWILNNYAETQFAGDSVVTKRVRRKTQPNNFSADVIGLTVVRPESLGAAALYQYVQYLRRNGLVVHKYAVAFWGRIASSAATIPMCVLALPFALGRLRSSGAGARMIVGVIIGLAYFLASRGLADGGEVYDLNPVLVAWLPTIALTVATLIALTRTR
jgi:lipopolysaccharide export system permease protein